VTGLQEAIVVTIVLLIAGCATTKRTVTESLSTMTAKARIYAACMRSHGAADFPDPQVVVQGGKTGVAFIYSGPGLAPANTTHNDPANGSSVARSASSRQPPGTHGANNSCRGC
jgi:hypothetical protein